jgi:hypothetical protein
MAAVRGHFGTERVEREFSTYYVANDIRTVWTGMHIAISDPQWGAAFNHLTLPELATTLLA